MLKNYTTNKDCNRTIAEIERTLAGMGARKILKEYDEHGNTESIQFMMPVNDREVLVKLPARIDRIPAALRAITNNQKVTSSQRSLLKRAMSEPGRAANIGWRIIQDWLEAQIAVMQLDQVNMLEVLLPFTVWGGGGETLYELLESNGFSMDKVAGRLLENRTNEEWRDAV